ncbi:MAG: InlB B-repeat-containing protein, partial [Clostridiales bacterium]|nr:InlB B-repeat-containing protein [Clostridiales bacterium]
MKKKFLALLMITAMLLTNVIPASAVTAPQPPAEVFYDACDAISAEFPLLLEHTDMGSSSDIIDSLKSQITDILSDAGISHAVDVQQWEIGAGGNGKFYFMDSDPVRNNNLELETMDPFEMAVSLILSVDPLPLMHHDVITGYDEDIIDFFIGSEGCFTDAIAASGLDPVDVQKWAIRFGGDDCFYLMDPYGLHPENFKLPFMTPFEKAIEILDVTGPPLIPQALILANDTAGIQAYLESYVSDLVYDDTGMPAYVAYWSVSDGGDGKYYLMDPYGTVPDNYLLNTEPWLVDIREDSLPANWELAGRAGDDFDYVVHDTGLFASLIIPNAALFEVANVSDVNLFSFSIQTQMGGYSSPVFLLPMLHMAAGIEENTYHFNIPNNVQVDGCGEGDFVKLFISYAGEVIGTMTVTLSLPVYSTVESIDGYYADGIGVLLGEQLLANDYPSGIYTYNVPAGTINGFAFTLIDDADAVLRVEAKKGGLPLTLGGEVLLGNLLWHEDVALDSAVTYYLYDRDVLIATVVIDPAPYLVNVISSSLPDGCGPVSGPLANFEVTLIRAGSTLSLTGVNPQFTIANVADSTKLSLVSEVNGVSNSMAMSLAVPWSEIYWGNFPESFGPLADGDKISYSILYDGAEIGTLTINIKLSDTDLVSIDGYYANEIGITCGGIINYPGPYTYDAPLEHEKINGFAFTLDNLDDAELKVLVFKYPFFEAVTGEVLLDNLYWHDPIDLDSPVTYYLYDRDELIAAVTVTPTMQLVNVITPAAPPSYGPVSGGAGVFEAKVFGDTAPITIYPGDIKFEIANVYGAGSLWAEVKRSDGAFLSTHALNLIGDYYQLYSPPASVSIPNGMDYIYQIYYFDGVESYPIGTFTTTASVEAYVNYIGGYYYDGVGSIQGPAQYPVDAVAGNYTFQAKLAHQEIFGIDFQLGAVNAGNLDKLTVEVAKGGVSLPVSGGALTLSGFAHDPEDLDYIFVYTIKFDGNVVATVTVNPKTQLLDIDTLTAVNFSFNKGEISYNHNGQDGYLRMEVLNNSNYDDIAVSDVLYQIANVPGGKMIFCKVGTWTNDPVLGWEYTDLGIDHYLTPAGADLYWGYAIEDAIAMGENIEYTLYLDGMIIGRFVIVHNNAFPAVTSINGYYYGGVPVITHGGIKYPEIYPDEIIYQVPLAHSIVSGFNFTLDTPVNSANLSVIATQNGAVLDLDDLNLELGSSYLYHDAVLLNAPIVYELYHNGGLLITVILTPTVQLRDITQGSASFDASDVYELPPVPSGDFMVDADLDDYLDLLYLNGIEFKIDNAYDVSMLSVKTQKNSNVPINRGGMVDLGGGIFKLSAPLGTLAVETGDTFTYLLYYGDVPIGTFTINVFIPGQLLTIDGYYANDDTMPSGGQQDADSLDLEYYYLAPLTVETISGLAFTWANLDLSKLEVYVYVNGASPYWYSGPKEIDKDGIIHDPISMNAPIEYHIFYDGPLMARVTVDPTVQLTGIAWPSADFNLADLYKAADGKFTVTVFGGPDANALDIDWIGFEIANVADYLKLTVDTQLNGVDYATGLTMDPSGAGVYQLRYPLGLVDAANHDTFTFTFNYNGKWAGEFAVTLFVPAKLRSVDGYYANADISTTGASFSGFPCAYNAAADVKTVSGIDFTWTNAEAGKITVTAAKGGAALWLTALDITTSSIKHDPVVLDAALVYTIFYDGAEVAKVTLKPTVRLTDVIQSSLPDSATPVSGVGSDFTTNIYSYDPVMYIPLKSILFEIFGTPDAADLSLQIEKNGILLPMVYPMEASGVNYIIDSILFLEGADGDSYTFHFKYGSDPIGTFTINFFELSAPGAQFINGYYSDDLITTKGGVLPWNAAGKYVYDAPWSYNVINGFAYTLDNVNLSGLSVEASKGGVAFYPDPTLDVIAFSTIRFLHESVLLDAPVTYKLYYEDIVGKTLLATVIINPKDPDPTIHEIGFNYTEKSGFTVGWVVEVPDGESILDLHEDFNGWKLSDADGEWITLWYTDADRTVLYDFSAPVNSSFTLYAEWISVEEFDFTVNFNSNGGSSVVKQFLKDGEIAVKPADPVRRGFDFLGWFSDPACTIDYNFAAPVIADLDLYAGWERVFYIVSFETNDGAPVPAEQEVPLGGKAVIPVTDPAKADHVFAGWYKDAAFVDYYNFNDVVTDDITIFAKWRAASDTSAYTIRATAGANGTIEPCAVFEVAAGANQTFTFAPGLNFEVDTIEVDGMAATLAGSYTFTSIAANHTIHVTFKSITASYTIAASAGANGSISPSGSVSVIEGGNQTFNFTPAAGYEVDTVTVDGLAV